MNTQKLDALASQAGFDVDRLRAPHPGGFPREDMLALESFAELIVKECMEQVWYTREDSINGNVSEVIKQRIEQHFGVKE